MPTTPYAKLQVSVNGGGAQTGGVTANAGDSIQLTAESTVGWGSNPASPVARWEISSYPTGYAQPAGWSTDGTSGAYYFLGNTSPPAFTLGDAAHWGDYMLRLLVDGGVKAGVTNLSDMQDTSTAIRVLSASGLQDLGVGETTQFSATRKWVGSVQANWRIIDTSLGLTISATSAATPNTIAKRGSSGESAFGYAQLGAAPYASAGILRLSANQAIKGRNNGNTVDINWFSQNSTDDLTVGDVTNAASVTVGAKSAGSTYLTAGGGTYVQVTSTVMRPLGLSLSWDSASAAPVVTQAAIASTGVGAGNSFSVTAQAGRPQSGGANNNNGGDVIISGGAAGTGGSGTAGLGGGVQMKAGSQGIFSFTYVPSNSEADIIVDPGLAGGYLRGTGSQSWVFSIGVLYFECTTINVDTGNLAIRDATQHPVVACTNNGIGATTWQIGSTVTSYTLNWADLTTNSGTGATTTIQGQNETGTTSTGGAVVIKSGTGTTVNGAVSIQALTGTLNLDTASLKFRDSGSADTITWALASGGTTSAIVATGATAVTIKQADKTTNSSTGAALTIQAQNETGTTSTGGLLALTSGTGTTAAGAVRLQTGGTDRVSVQPSLVQLLASQLQQLRNVATYGTTTTFDMTLGNVQQVTLNGGNITTLNLNNMKDGAIYYFVFIQDGTGSRTLTVPSAMKTAGTFTLSTGASKRDTWTGWSDGTNVYEISRGMNV